MQRKQGMRRALNSATQVSEIVLHFGVKDRTVHVTETQAGHLPVLLMTRRFAKPLRHDWHFASRAHCARSKMGPKRTSNGVCLTTFSQLYSLRSFEWEDD